MTTWKEALVLLLSGISDLVALTNSRISHERSRQGDPLPRVVFSASSSVIGNTLDGGPDGLPLVRVQLDCFAPTGAQADEMAYFIRRPVPQGGISGYRGYVQDCFIQSLLIEDEGRDEFLMSQTGADAGTHRVSLDLKLSYEEF